MPANAHAAQSCMLHAPAANIVLSSMQGLVSTLPGARKHGGAGGACGAPAKQGRDEMEDAADPSLPEDPGGWEVRVHHSFHAARCQEPARP